MTPVGHTLLGAAIGVACSPPHWSNNRTAALAALGAFSANAPDLPLPGWGHDRYAVSHGVFVNAALIGAMILLLVALRRMANVPRALSPRVLGAASVAWLSHFLLDSFYNHGLGVAVLWPLSDARLALPLPPFQTYAHTPLLSWPTFRVLGVEAVCYLPLVLLAVSWRWRSRANKRLIH